MIKFITPTSSTWKLVWVHLNVYISPSCPDHTILQQVHLSQSCRPLVIQDISILQSGKSLSQWSSNVVPEVQFQTSSVYQSRFWDCTADCLNLSLDMGPGSVSEFHPGDLWQRGCEVLRTCGAGWEAMFIHGSHVYNLSFHGDFINILIDIF